jgi:hypothetical protein
MPRKAETVALNVDGAVLTFSPQAGIALTVHAIDGKYPPYERVIPREVDGTAGNYDPSILERVGSALQALGGSKSQQCVRLFQNGPDRGAWIMSETAQHIAHLAVLMPLRVGMDIRDANKAAAAVLA